MKKHRFKLKPTLSAPRPAPAPAAETPRPAAPDLAAAFSEAVETLRRNLHCDRPAAQNQAAFMLYKIYCQEVKLPALEQGLHAIESNLGLKGVGRSPAARLTQIERATARLREEERRESERAAHREHSQQRVRDEALVKSSALRQTRLVGQRCALPTEALAALTEEGVDAATGLSAESERRYAAQEGRVRDCAPHLEMRAAHELMEEAAHTPQTARAFGNTSVSRAAARAPEPAPPPAAPPASVPERAPAIAPEGRGRAPGEETEAEESRRRDERARADARGEERWTALKAQVEQGTRPQALHTG